MKSFISRHKMLSTFLAVPIVLVSALIIFEYGGGPVGYIEAKWDLFRGSYKVKGAGGVIWWEQYLQLLSERYQVKVDPVAPCNPSSWELAYSEAYNSVSKPAIREKFQKDIFKECNQDSIRLCLSSDSISDEKKRILEIILKSE